LEGNEPGQVYPGSGVGGLRGDLSSVGAEVQDYSVEEHQQILDDEASGHLDMMVEADCVARDPPLAFLGPPQGAPPPWSLRQLE
jgi:hypothetical protein